MKRQQWSRLWISSGFLFALFACSISFDLRWAQWRFMAIINSSNWYPYTLWSGSTSPCRIFLHIARYSCTLFDPSVSNISVERFSSLQLWFCWHLIRICKIKNWFNHFFSRQVLHLNGNWIKAHEFEWKDRTSHRHNSLIITWLWTPLRLCFFFPFLIHSLHHHHLYYEMNSIEKPTEFVYPRDLSLISS